MNLRATTIAAVATVGLAGSALTALPAAGAAPEGTGFVTYRGHEPQRNDVQLSSRRWIKKAAADPRDANVSAFSYTVDYEKHRFRFFAKLDDLRRPATERGNTTSQYIDFFVSYVMDGKPVEAFGWGVSSVHPRVNELGADSSVVSDRCGRSVRDAPVRTSFVRDTVRGSVSLACIPVGTTIQIDGWSQMWVNPSQPPNHQIAGDWLDGIDFTRRAR